MLARRWDPAADFLRAARFPFRILVLTFAVNGVIAGVRGERREVWWQVSTQTAHLLSIAAGAWLLCVMILFFVDLALRGADLDPDTRRSGRVRTQMLIVRRLVVAAVVVLAVGAMLFTFPGVRALGASVLASAGLISVVAALAAQSTLANVFAGMQLAFSDAIRIDDAVVVAEQYGYIEEITLSYVVVRTWDTRRLVLPCNLLHQHAVRELDASLLLARRRRGARPRLRRRRRGDALGASRGSCTTPTCGTATSRASRSSTPSAASCRCGPR